METTVTAGRALRGKSLLAALALALLVSVGTAAGAGAERPPSGGDSHQRGCRAIYDQAERNRAEIKLLGVTNPSSARIDQLLAENRILGQDWISLKCKDRYGSIAHLVVGPYHPITADPIIANPGGVSHPLLSESSPRVTLGDTNIEPAAEPVLASAAEEIVVPALEADAVVTTQPVLAPVADESTVPTLEVDAVVTTQPVPPAVAEEILVPEFEEGEVVTTQPAPVPVAEAIDVPEIEEDPVVTTQPGPAPGAAEIVVLELEEDPEVTTQPVPEPVAEEITIPEIEEDPVVTTEPVAAADEQP